MRHLFHVAAFAVVCGLCVGCGGGGGDVTAGDDNKVALEDFGRMLQGLPADNWKPPTNLKELEKMEPAAPVGVQALKNNRIVYLWGAGYVANGKKVVAYETSAETAGGFVLLEDGSVSKMTAEELKAAPKAGKK